MCDDDDEDDEAVFIEPVKCINSSRMRIVLMTLRITDGIRKYTKLSEYYSTEFLRKVNDGKINMNIWEIRLYSRIYVGEWRDLNRVL